MEKICLLTCAVQTLLKMTKIIVSAKSAKEMSSPYVSEMVTSDTSCGRNASNPTPKPDGVPYLSNAYKKSQC